MKLLGIFASKQLNDPHLLLYMTRVSQQCRALGFSENPSSLT
jgi:hypothetical protein